LFSKFYKELVTKNGMAELATPALWLLAKTAHRAVY
jgi:hypothetical protein